MRERLHTLLSRETELSEMERQELSNNLWWACSPDDPDREEILLIYRYWEKLNFKQQKNLNLAFQKCFASYRDSLFTDSNLLQFSDFLAMLKIAFRQYQDYDKAIEKLYLLLYKNFNSESQVQLYQIFNQITPSPEIQQSYFKAVYFALKGIEEEMSVSDHIALGFNSIPSSIKDHPLAYTPLGAIVAFVWTLVNLFKKPDYVQAVRSIQPELFSPENEDSDSEDETSSGGRPVQVEEDNKKSSPASPSAKSRTGSNTSLDHAWALLEKKKKLEEERNEQQTATTVGSKVMLFQPAFSEENNGDVGSSSVVQHKAS